MLVFIRDVPQLDGKVCKSLLTVRAGHMIANLNNKRGRMNQDDRISINNNIKSRRNVPNI